MIFWNELGNSEVRQLLRKAWTNTRMLDAGKVDELVDRLIIFPLDGFDEFVEADEGPRPESPRKKAINRLVAAINQLN